MIGLPSLGQFVGTVTRLFYDFYANYSQAMGCYYIIPEMGNGEPGTGVWELVYSGNPLENSKWRSKQKKRNNLGKREFLPAVPADGQYVLARAESH